MGEIADMMINGDMDFYTGEYIGRGNGIPRTLDGSLPWERRREDMDLSSRARTFGVCKWLDKNGYDFKKVGMKRRKLIKSFAVSVLSEPDNKSIEHYYCAVSDNFDTFTNWLNDRGYQKINH